MMLDRLSPEEVTALEATGVPIVYDLDISGNAISKKILNE
jgi:bisphosphoglycerate-dependent phosphoglycerate mutase